MIECKNLGVLFYIGFVCLFTFILLPLLPNNECIAFNKSLSLKQLQYSWCLFYCLNICYFCSIRCNIMLNISIIQHNLKLILKII